MDPGRAMKEEMISLAAPARPVLPAVPSTGLAAILADPALRHSLRAMVRRRVPSSEADDIVQATLCDALAAVRVPTDPGDVPRWVMAIGRNKISDHFRRAGREERCEDAPVQLLVEPVEERALLREIVDDAHATPSALRTLGWVVREAAGEQLADIAEEERLPATVVRQRISRWRKRARTVFLLAAASLAIAFVGREVYTFISPTIPVSTTAAPARVAGTWRIVESHVPDTADVRLQNLATTVTASSRLVVEGNRARFETLGVPIVRAYELEPAAADAEVMRGTMTTHDGVKVPIEIRFDPDGAVIKGGGASFRLAR
jgi:DNA-directed RNA polymerase specialized sigma24 family protein